MIYQYSVILIQSEFPIYPDIFKRKTPYKTNAHIFSLIISQELYARNYYNSDHDPAPKDTVVDRS